MTDRYAGYVVTLGEDIREDDAESIETALLMVRGVVAVEPIVADYEKACAEARVRHDIAKRLSKLTAELLRGKADDGE